MIIVTLPAIMTTASTNRVYGQPERMDLRAWLIQIENAGHAVMDQYPDEINKILQTFLSTTTPAQPE